MKSKIEESGQNRYLAQSPVNRTRLAEAAPAGFGQGGIDAATLDEISGGAIPAKGCLHQHREHKGGEILGD